MDKGGDFSAFPLALEVAMLLKPLTESKHKRRGGKKKKEEVMNGGKERSKKGRRKERKRKGEKEEIRKIRKTK